MPSATVYGSSALNQTMRLAFFSLFLFAGCFWASSGFREHYVFDEGYFGLEARLVREGQWPHVQVRTVYTGLHAFFNALVTWVSPGELDGIRLISVSLPLLLCALVFIPTSRMIHPALAAVVAVAGLAFGHHYTVGVAYPSWHAVVAGMLAVLALTSARSTPGPLVLLIAGSLAGVSGLFKQTHGGFTLCALVLIWWELWARNRHPTASRVSIAVLLAMVAAAFVTFLSVPGRLGDYWPLLVPLTCCLVTIAHRLFAGPKAGSPGLTVRQFWSGNLLLAVGAGLAVAAFLLPYVLRHGTPALSAIWKEALVDPRRFVRVGGPLPTDTSISLLLVALIGVTFFLSAAWASRRTRTLLLAAGMAALGFGLAPEGQAAELQRMRAVAMQVIQWTILAGPIVACLASCRSSPSRGAPPDGLYAMAAFTATTSFVLYPVADEIYYPYVWPTALASLVAGFSRIAGIGHRADPSRGKLPAQPSSSGAGRWQTVLSILLPAVPLGGLALVLGRLGSSAAPLDREIVTDAGRRLVSSELASKVEWYRREVAPLVGDDEALAFPDTDFHLFIKSRPPTRFLFFRNNNIHGDEDQEVRSVLEGRAIRWVIYNGTEPISDFPAAPMTREFILSRYDIVKRLMNERLFRLRVGPDLRAADPGAPPPAIAAGGIKP